jgi:hypothetical protein
MPFTACLSEPINLYSRKFYGFQRVTSIESITLLAAISFYAMPWVQLRNEK